MAESRRDEIAKLEALYASNPDGRVFTHLAEAYRRAGELDRAREILERGLQRHPDYPSAHVVLGRVQADLGNGEEAATAFRRVLELDPENLIARRSLAEAARAAGRDEDALLHYRALLAQDPSAPDVMEIVEELEARLHGPPAPPPTASGSWSTSRDEESWDAPPPAAPVGFDTFDQAMSPPEAPAFGMIDPGAAFGDTDAAAGPDVSPFDPVPLDLSGIDFGGSTAAPAAPTTPEPFEPEAETGIASAEPVAEPAAPDVVHDSMWPAPAAAGEPPADAAAGTGGNVGTAPIHTDEPEPFAGRPTVEAPLEHDELAAPAAEPAELEEPAAAESASVADDLPAPAAPAGSEAPRLEEAERLTRAPAAQRDGSDAYGVPTETLAALYEAQGFPDRAAAVYHALLRDRPDDERLRERARAADEAAAALRAERSGIEETRDVWVSGNADSSWDSAARSRTAYAWDDEGEEEGDVAAGPSIGEYLERVLSWRPVEAAFAPAPEPDAPAAGAAADERAAEDVALEDVPFEEPAHAWAREPGPSRDEVLEPWEVPAHTDDDHETIDGFVFGGGPDEQAAAAPPATVPPAAAPPPAAVPPAATPPAAVPGDAAAGIDSADSPAAGEPRSAGDDLEIEYGYGLAPGESAFGAHPPAGASELQLDTLLPLPPEEAAVEPEQPATWFEAEPAGRDEAAAAVGPDLPFDFAEPDTGEDAPVAEPLPFDFEEIGTDAESPEAEPLPFDLAALGADIDDEPGDPLPFEVDEAVEPPYALPEHRPEPEPAPAEAMLELQETEAVSEAAAPAEDGWDPTVALADVASVPHARPEARLRMEGGARPAPAPSTRPPAREEPEEDEDEDLEMFRSWLQSLKR